MIDFVEYVIGELSSKRLAKADALDLIRQFQGSAIDRVPQAVIDSLLQRNTSDFSEQRYETVFTGDEPFLRDHVVKGHRVLPGVAYLEMVRQAVAAALPEAADAVLELRNVVWAQPIVVDERKTIAIALFPAESNARDGAIDYEIYSVAAEGDDAAQDVIHSQGQILLTPAGEPVQPLDLDGLRERMVRGCIDGERLYAAFDAMEMQYGPAQRAVHVLQQGEDEVLARLVVPSAWREADGNYGLHPSLMDAALQSALGFIEDIDAAPPTPRLPYALDRLRILSECTQDMTAWLRLSPEQSASRRVTRIDIDLCDADGRVCVQWRGFSSRELGAPAAEAAAPSAGVLFAAPEWKDRSVANETSSNDATERHVLLCGDFARLDSALDGVVSAVVPGDLAGDPAAAYRDVALACFGWLRERFEHHSTTPVRLQIVVPDDDSGHLLFGLSGMLRSAALENPAFSGQVIALPADASVESANAELASAASLPQDVVQRFGHDGAHRAQVWREREADAEPATPAYRDGGVYVITGGLGGLGVIFARDIAAQATGAKLVLTGRATADDAVAAKVSALGLPEGTVEYRALDLSDRDAVAAFVAGVVARHGRLDGILHCAGGLRDDFILKKSADDVAAVLEPKVAGTRHLDEATRDLDLDFIALFSGGASVTGNVGQSDYAAANGFMDRYAAYRNALAARGERHGITRAINWPLWRDGGMGVSEDTLENARRFTGLEPLDTAAGLAAFGRILAWSHDQVQLVQGDVDRLRRTLFATQAVPVPSAASDDEAAPLADDAMREGARAFMRQKLSGLLKLPAHLIEMDAPFEKYGINSIMMMNLTNVLEEAFGSLPKTLFFEYQTLEELTGYFVDHHGAALAKLLDRPARSERAEAPRAEAAASTELIAAEPPTSRAARRRQRFGAGQPVREAARQDEPIAVVGLSGRYPGARDLAAFWRNLRDGVDSIEEVPASRWDWRDYFTEDRTRPGHHYSKWGGFIEGVDEFDALFFNIPPVDAERIDPQERIFLEHAWMAIEDAGYTRAALQIPHGGDQAGQVGVYVGVMYGEYQIFGAEASLVGDRGVTPSSYASIANRVSYFLNLHGPSMALDTMCSSSLTAIHLACQDLRQGRTDLAIAGGVNITIHPNKYLLLSSGQFIATDGRCQSFGVGGDGYIPAEGVGAVVLKRLSEAERDGNPIHGILRGSALNHGGKTNGYSVPNPQSQANVIAMALQECGVDARRIGYLEAHGTGTKLGDPIEIAALTQAFRKHTPDKGFCLIGSAKSNIGHAESAAGIAGLTKVLLQMKHGQVAPSLHADVLNPHIDFANTPFEVNRVLRPWPRPDIDGRPAPRLAGLSSFGAGGSNAHLVIEEYLPAARRATNARGPQAVLLSARSTEQLEQKARDLLAFVREDAVDADLADVAWTLQLGREAMEERLALVVESIDALGDALAAWLADGATGETCHRGRANAAGGAVALFNTDSDLQGTIDRWFATGRLMRVAELWVQGVAIDWRKAHADDTRPRFVSLPTYPFARDRCWVERTLPVGRTAGGAALHPLLHANVSDLHGQAYRSTFSGQEFFLDDHRVRFGAGEAQRLLPGVAYLEMMRAAAIDAMPEWRDGVALELHDIAWSRPLVVADATAVTVALEPDAQGDIAMVVTTDGPAGPLQHGAGRVREATGDAPAPLALDKLRARMSHGALVADAIYPRYAQLGIDYGRSFRCIEGIALGQGEVLAQLALPPIAQPTADDYGLHPALMDSAFQSAIGLLVAAGRSVDQVPLPFALRATRVFAPCPTTAWAWVRPSREGEGEGGVVELDIDVCAADGTVCVELRGLASRPARREDLPAADVLLAVPTWASIAAGVSHADDGAHRELLVCDLSSLDAQALVAPLPDATCLVSHANPDDDLGERYRVHAQRLLALLRDGTGAQAGAKRRVQVVVPGDDAGRVLAGLDAMLRSAAMENPALGGQLVLVPADAGIDTVARALRDAAALAHEPVLEWRDGALRVRRWQVLDDAAPQEAPSFRADGVYVITGGMGGLGRIFARHLLARAPQAQVVLTGRQPLDAERRQQFDALADGSGRLHYRAMDLADAAQVAATIDGIVQAFGGLHGVLHSAGATQDGLLPGKTAEILDAVLAPKVAAALHLDAATRALDLDCFVLFSSVSGALGNIGQVDYAAANGFLDRFAAHRDRLVAKGERRGRTLSINWPLWAEGGMGLEPAAIDLLWRTAGVRPLPTAAGLDVFERGLGGVSAPQLLVLSGDRLRLKALLEPRVPIAAPPAAKTEAGAKPAAAGPADVSLDAQARAYLQGVFSRVLKVAPHRIDPQASLEHYGIDSVVAMTLTAELEKLFGTLPKTLLFEFQTIERLARHLLATFPQRMGELLGPATSAATAVATPAPVAVVRERASAVPNRFRRAPAAVERQVAIVGVAGRYPQADSLDVFWGHLRAGRDCITEVPADRWDHAQYFDPSRNRPGRTYAKWGGFLADIDAFDALFFNVSPREAELIDPQERLFLETAWETFEDAGYAKERLAGQRIGVYVGVMWGQYELYAGDGTAGIPTSSHASVANRVSYFFDLHGPSLALDTMCSSSLSAIHLAAQDIRHGTVDAALAGGVNLSLHPQKYLNLSQGNFASTDGRCRSFGDGGDGYVPGEGAGAVLLKPLDAALRDGDRVLAILEASALNHGGKTHGYTVPNPVAQASLIVDVLKAADIDPRRIGYIETHGTGTSLGDPIELAGLRQAFAEVLGDGAMAPGACAIGSVKSNIGHLEAAAGIAALTKVLLQLRHGELVPSLHAIPPNPHIDFASSPFRVQTALAPWPRPEGQPRRAAVSAFGAGGANAHLVVAEYVDDRAASRSDDAVAGPELFLLSARDDAGLARYARRVAAFLERDDVPALRDIAHTSRVGRTVLPVRLAVLAESRDALREKLSRWAASAPTGASAPRASAIDDCYAGRVLDGGAGDLIPGDVGQAFLGELLNRGDWRALARLWVAGADIDWRGLPSAIPPKRVSLPTYPFARERYWVRGGMRAALAAASPSTVAVSSPVSALPAPTFEPATLLQRPEWVEQPLAPASADATIAGPVLVLGADADWREALAARLGATPVIGVSFGAVFEALAPDRIVIDPARDEDLDRLVTLLQANDRMPRVVLHRPEPTQIAGDDTTAVLHGLDRTAHVVAALAKALMAHRHAGETRFLSLIAGTSAVDRALGAALGGFYASLRQEHPGYRTRVVVAQGTRDAELDRVLAELADAAWGSESLRYVARADGRTVRERRRWTAQPPAPRRAERSALRQHGVYLITGGMGALGGLLAETLARRCQAKLVLLGRSQPNDAIEARLAALRALGAEAVYLSAEVADAAQAEAAVAEARQRFGRIDGVLHAAGIHRDAYLLKKSREDRIAVYAAKVPGALHLDHATRDDDLDLFVLFGSIAGALGNAGQTDYAYANHFLDAFAHERQARVAVGERRGRTLSIDWPLWATDGMRVQDEAVAQSNARAGIVPLPEADGIDVFERLLDGTDVQTLVLHGDAGRIEAALRALDDTGAPRAATGAGPAGEGDLADRTRDYLRARIGEEIRLDPERIDAHERFDAFGIDSMMVSRLNERLTVDLGPLSKTLFYEYSTVDELAAYLVREVPGPLSTLLGAAPAAAIAIPVDTPIATVAVPATATAPAIREGERARAVVEPIAIVGMHGYYPKSQDLDALWAHLHDGDDLIDVVPADRWDAEAFHDPDPDHAAQGRIYCKWGAFLDDHDKFDAAFFRIGDAEASSIDPQERLFLQSVWGAFEDAGMTRDDLRRRFPKGKGAHVGVFVGVTSNTYHLLDAEHWQDGEGASPSSLPWSIANRVSYVFDFLGASLPVDTACSSSLVAIHLACESLRRDECKVAVAGGVNLYLHPAKYHGLCQRRMLAVHGKCRSYGSGDDGFIPGEGVGSLVLKPLSLAERDGDRIHGVILASGQDHSGRSNGYSAPNPNSQAALVAEVLKRANVEAASIGYVEGHGTGTQLGDSLEVRALTQAFGAVPAQSCTLGSIKANVGHTESAAGVLGVTKVLLQMRHGRFVPSLHADPVNENIEFERTPFRLVRETETWEAPAGQRRRALVNSFGAGGVNACLVLEEYRPAIASTAARAPSPELFVLSARTEAQLRAYAGLWVDALRRDGAEHDLAIIARVSRTGREAMVERLAVVADDVPALAERLEAWLKGTDPGVYRGSVGASRTGNGRLGQEEGMLTALVQAQDLHGMAQAWVAGSDVPWHRLPGTADVLPFATLPTYPFAKVRHWPSFAAVRPKTVDVPAEALHLHPLVSHNASNLWETRYTSVLSREAFYAKDHRVNGQPMLPGSAWIEIARAAGSLAAMTEVRRLRDVVFVRPLAFAEPMQVAVTTLQTVGDEVLYSIASHDPEQGTVVHSEGALDCGAAHASVDAAARVPVAALMAQARVRIDCETCYARFRRSGIEYGPSFQTIQEMHAGDGFVLARLALHPSLWAEADEFGLHPALVDAAFQSLSGFAEGEGGAGPFLPFAVDEVAIHGMPSRQCFAYVVESTRPRPGKDDLRKFDIELVTEDGAPAVSLKGLTVRSFKPAASSPTPLSSESFS